MVKTCTKCNVSKDFSLFYKQHDAKHGLTPNCKECVNKIRKQWRLDNPDKVKENRVQHAYGISYTDVKTMHKEQHGRCLICEDKPKNLVIDHCHSTGKVRGLLCSECNLMLGKARDRTKTLENAIKYLERFLNDKS